MLDAILEGDPDHAEQAVIQHLQASKDLGAATVQKAAGRRPRAVMDMARTWAVRDSFQSNMRLKDSRSSTRLCLSLRLPNPPKGRVGKHSDHRILCDCDDLDAAVNPCASEIPADRTDDDCDGLIDE